MDQSHSRPILDREHGQEMTCEVLCHRGVTSPLLTIPGISVRAGKWGRLHPPSVTKEGIRHPRAARIAKAPEKLVEMFS